VTTAQRAGLHPVVDRVTRRIASRSADSRAIYLERIASAAGRGPARGRLACANFAHGLAAMNRPDKQALHGHIRPNVAIVSAYNDMLSAHQPFETYPAALKAALREAGGVGQFAGGVPAMCDGITQGRDGMQLSLFSRDLIAMATAVALAHDMFDAALLLGVCDKIVPGLVIGALAFGHLPVILVPAGPMPSGLPNKDKSLVRQRYAEGQASREELLAAETASYHSAGTCTFYGTANSNQMLMEVMGLHLPGASFVSPGSPLRAALTAAAARQVLTLTALTDRHTPIGQVVDERAVVNGVVALLATGGSTNHTLHLPAMAAAAGIQLTWDDFAELSAVVPLLARIYPNGPADVNHFHAAGGTSFLISELLKAGLLHPDVTTVAGGGLDSYRREPVLDGAALAYRPGPDRSADPDVLRPAADPFAPDGGLQMLGGNLGHAVMKVSAVAAKHRSIEAPAAVFDDQHDFLAAFRRGELNRDFVAVVRYQGPSANGMPELHKLIPALGALQDRGHRVALVTDGRMSGASGKVPAAIHLTPEAAADGPIARIRNGDVIRVDARADLLEVLVGDAELGARPVEGRAPDDASWTGTGRELFASFRQLVGAAERGASVIPAATEGLRLMPRLTPADLLDLAPVIPVVVIDEPAHAVPIARALLAGGIPIIEVTLRTPRALDAIRAITDSVPHVLVGAGTVTTPALVRQAADAGAQFLVSPGATDRLLAAVDDAGLPWLPGVATVSEVMRLLDRGQREMKFFPAEASGGRGFLRAIAAPCPAARFCPTGGITPATAARYRELSNVGCVGGTWLTPPDAIAAQDWRRIELMAADCLSDEPPTQ
jgi:phosphogluconate dehydratase